MQTQGPRFNQGWVVGRSTPSPTPHVIIIYGWTTTKTTVAWRTPSCVTTCTYNMLWFQQRMLLFKALPNKDNGHGTSLLIPRVMLSCMSRFKAVACKQTRGKHVECVNSSCWCSTLSQKPLTRTVLDQGCSRLPAERIMTWDIIGCRSVQRYWAWPSS